MKKNTEINIELKDDDSWTASSPDYPDWECRGTDRFGSADVAARSLERWCGLSVCPKCGRRYSAPPAVSRENGESICPICSYIEAMENVDAIDLETKERLVDELIKIEVQNGRVERMRV